MLKWIIDRKIILMVAFGLILIASGVFLRSLISISPLSLPKEVNLKNIQLSDKPTFNLNIKNISNTNVEIPRVYTSCGCTTVLEPTNSFNLKPKSSKDIKMQFDPSSMHKSGDVVYHEIYILTTKPSEKEYVVKMTGKVL